MSDHENHEMLTTNEAALLLRRAPQTLRQWASGDGPIKPVRLRGKRCPLLWSRTAIEDLMSGRDPEVEIERLLERIAKSEDAPIAVVERRFGRDVARLRAEAARVEA